MLVFDDFFEPRFLGLLAFFEDPVDFQEAAACFMVLPFFISLPTCRLYAVTLRFFATIYTKYPRVAVRIKEVSSRILQLEPPFAAGP